MTNRASGSLSSHLVALLCCAVIWAMFFNLSGTLPSGFHFTDDHQILTLREELTQKGGNIIAVFRDFMKTDLQVRFRPVYVFHRICQTAILGADFFKWSVYNGALAVLTTFFLYLFCRLIGFSFGQALLFPILAMVGPQMTIWYRLGPSETLAMPLAAIALFCMGLSVSTSRGRGWWGFLFVIFAALMALSKESFVLLLPALGFWKIWLCRERERCSWGRAVRNNLPSLFFLALCTAAILFVICVYVGTDRMGYAGWDGNRVRALFAQSMQALRHHEFQAAGATFYALLKPFLQAAWQLLRGSEIWIAIITVYSLWICRGQEEGRLSLFGWLRMRGLVPAILLAGLIIVPQVMLYAQSGIVERYRLPAAMGISFLAVWAYREAAFQVPPLRKFLVTLLLLYLALAGTASYRQARWWGERGVMTNDFLEEIKYLTRPEDRIVIVADPAREYEWTHSLRTYLTLEANRENIYLHYLENPPYTQLQERYLRSSYAEEWFQKQGNQQLAGAGPAACVAIFPGREEKFISAPPAWFNPAQYQRTLMPFPREDSEQGFVIYYQEPQPSKPEVESKGKSAD